MKELKYPAERRYWVAYDGKTVHYGVTEPDQVTTTGLAQFNYYTTLTDCETKLKTDLKISQAVLNSNSIDPKMVKDEISPIDINR